MSLTPLRDGVSGRSRLWQGSSGRGRREAAGQGLIRPALVIGSNRMGIRSRRRMITCCYHMTVITAFIFAGYVGTKINHQGIVAGAGSMLILHVLTFRIIPLDRYIAQWLIHRAVCPGCHQSIVLKSYWKCGCGFQSWMQRSALSACLECGKGFKWVVCACGTTVPV